MNNKIGKTKLSEVDLKVLDVLKTENKELTLKEIASETGEKPRKVAKSLWKLFLNTEKLRCEMLLKIYV